MSKTETTILLCSFCGKSQYEVRKLIAGPTVFICDECVILCIDMIVIQSYSEERAAYGIVLAPNHSEKLENEGMSAARFIKQSFGGPIPSEATVLDLIKGMGIVLEEKFGTAADHLAKIIGLQKQIDDLPEDSEERELLEKQRNGLTSNPVPLYLYPPKD